MMIRDGRSVGGREELLTFFAALSILRLFFEYLFIECQGDHLSARNDYHLSTSQSIKISRS